MTTLRTFALAASFLGLAATTGCVSVNGSMVSSTAVTGEAWYIEGTGLPMFSWSSRVFYCPTPSAAGPSTCIEAKMIPLTPAEVEAEKPKK